ncbi:hypothetical protein [Lacticaseibacillus suibinensis]|uniref:hypothetical protein n=1 Tax=Lacticaseibacillus suibinensis TaxID=2486011 RepID=UPI0019431010|nr:hypothetical protein [Lacticaseibacillus suibinensis]
MMRDQFREAELSRQHEAEGEDEPLEDWKGRPVDESRDYLDFDGELVLLDELEDYARDELGATDYEP